MHSVGHSDGPFFAVAILNYWIQDREDAKQKGQLEIEKVKLEQQDDTPF